MSVALPGGGASIHRTEGCRARLDVGPSRASTALLALLIPFIAGACVPGTAPSFTATPADICGDPSCEPDIDASENDTTDAATSDSLTATDVGSSVTDAFADDALSAHDDPASPDSVVDPSSDTVPDSETEVSTPEVRCSDDATCSADEVCLGERCIPDCPAGTAGEFCDLECPVTQGGAVCDGAGTCNDGRGGDGRCVCDHGFSGSGCRTRATMQYTITTQTGSESGSSNVTHPIQIRLYGEYETSSWFTLQHGGPLFQAGRWNRFAVTQRYLGAVERIEFRMLANTAGECCNDWFVEHVWVEDEDVYFIFPLHRWLGRDETQWVFPELE